MKKTWIIAARAPLRPSPLGVPPHSEEWYAVVSRHDRVVGEDFHVVGPKYPSRRDPDLLWRATPFTSKALALRVLRELERREERTHAADHWAFRLVHFNPALLDLAEVE